MKKAQSQLIRDFLAHVQLGNISANDVNVGGTTAVQALEVMAVMLEAVLDGHSPDMALGITRTTGADLPTRWLSPDLSLAQRIHELRDRGEKWTVIAALLEISESKCKRLHKDYSDDVRALRTLADGLHPRH